MRPATALTLGALGLGALAPLGGCTRGAGDAPAERRAPSRTDEPAQTAEAPRPTDAPPVYTVPEVRARQPAPTPAEPTETARPEPPARPAPVAPEPEPEPDPADEPAAPEASAEVRGFVRRYFALQATNDVDALLGLYDRRVRYYALGEVDRRTVAEDKERYFRRWPDRTLRLVGPVRVEAGGAGPHVRIAYTYRVRGEEREREGTAWVELDLVRTPDGYRIAGERGGSGD